MAVVVCMIRAYYIRVCACNQSKILDVRCHRSIGLASSFHGRLRPPTIILNCIPLSLSLSTHQGLLPRHFCFYHIEI